MERFLLEEDLAVCCLQASPYSINEAHEKLRDILGSGRKHFTISFPHEDGILCWAAVEVNGHPSDETPGCEYFVLKRGNYISITTSALPEDISHAGQAFTQLFDNPGISPSSCFVTCYLTEGNIAGKVKDVRYMVRLAG